MGEPPGSTGVPLTAVPLLESRSYTVHWSSAERMRAACCRGDHGVVEQHIGGRAAAQDILPVGQGLRGPVGQGEAGPYFRLGRGLDQAADDPHQHQNGQNRKKRKRRISVYQANRTGYALRQLPQSVQAGLEGGGQVRQGDLLSE